MASARPNKCAKTEAAALRSEVKTEGHGWVCQHVGHGGQTLSYDRAAAKRESSQVIPERASKPMQKQEKGVTAGLRDGS